jgi:tetratricopeptide (TPR) repeat protein
MIKSMRKDRENPSRIGIFCWIGALLMGFVAADAEFAAAHSLDAQAPTHLTTRPAALARGVGREFIAIPESEANPEALALYVQGLAQLHGYRWIEAARAFHTSLRLDPTFVLAELGLVRAYEAMKDPVKADLHLERARALEAEAGSREALLIEAMALRRQGHQTGPNGQAAHLAYRRALDGILKAYPEDVEVLLLRGNASEAVAWGKGMSGREDSIPYYESAIRIAPEHPGARHYLAHSYENTGRYFEAASEAARFARLAPRVPHARHMYAHTLPRIGKWDVAVQELEAADALEREYFREEGIPADADWHRVHNLSLLGLAYLRVGRNREAAAALREAFRTPVPDPQTVTWHTIWPEYLLYAGRNDEALAAARKLSSNPNSISQIVGLALEGEAALNTADMERANEALVAARNRLALYQSREARQHPMGSPMGWVAEGSIQMLADRIALRTSAPTDSHLAIEERATEIAGRPGLDGWGAGWLRLLRLEKQARDAGHVALADRLATLSGGSPAPNESDASR